MRKFLHTKRDLQVGPNFQTNTLMVGALPAGVTKGVGWLSSYTGSGAQSTALLSSKKTPEQANSTAGSNQVYRDLAGTWNVVCMTTFEFRVLV